MTTNTRKSRDRSEVQTGTTTTAQRTREMASGREAINSEDKRRLEFEALVFEYLNAATRFARHLTRNDAEAQDLVQDSYLRAYRFFDQYNSGTNFKAWLFRILKNTFINEYRKKKRRPVHLELTGLETAVTTAGESPSLGGAEHSPGFGDVLLRDHIDAALARTPQVYRDVIITCLVKGHSYKEVAKALDIPLGTVMSRLYRGRQHLREVLSAEACESGVAKAC